ncbi:MAG TPA: helix-turn-helix domain-containing protein, partial [Anaerolineales bacterium]|nr:helix-turn-helix domain-containing protein [Anaerolineales bacterium]
MDEDLSFGAWLKRRRKSFDFTQSQLAELVGCSPSAIYKIEAEERRPSRQVAELLAERLEIPADERAAFVRWARGERIPASLPALALKGPALPALAAPPTDAPVFHSNLPVPMAPMIGRERELAGIEQLLADSNCRLLTLTGPGGIGKTRLALEIAHRRQADFPQGVFFVSLASVADVDFMIPAIANVLGLVFYGPEPPLQQLIRALRSRHALLVLDNLEHLLDGAQLISEILRGTQQVTCLVTSQKRLELHGEWVFEVQGLPLPDERQLSANQSSSAVRLFLENAQRVQPGFMPTDADYAAISRICRLLEGMPLGILLAASWVRALSCREVVMELEQDLDFLRTSAANIPERQRSLRAVFDHSWELLTGEERQALTNLAVFRGGFRREAAWEIADASIFTISTLVDKSLVRRTADGCYDLHELTRQFAYKRLETRTDRDDLLARHSAYYLNWIASQEKELKSADQKAVIDQFSLAFDNVRQAWKWAVQNRQYDALDRALRALMWFFELKGWFQDGAALFGWAVAELGYAMD